jgi:flavin-dependent dehydrogenase
MIVCADGSSSTFSSLIKGKNPNRKRSRTLEFWSSAEPTSPRFSKQSAIFDFSFLTDNLQGYFWEFPSIADCKPGHNRGVYDAQLWKNHNRLKLTHILERVMEPSEFREIQHKIKGAPINWFNPKNEISAFRTILVGDAAGADVLFGEGISPALIYGKIAAETIVKAFQDNDFRFASYKRNLLTSKLGRYLLIRRIIATYTYNLGIHSFFTHLLWTAGQFTAKIWRGKSLY